MKTFYPIIFVIVCLFVSIGQTINFCEAFIRNGHNISYGFDGQSFENGNSEIKPHLVIGFRYWQLMRTTTRNTLKFRKNDSEVVKTLADSLWNPYVLAFSVRSSDNSFNYGFIKNDSSIEWKDLKTKVTTDSIDNPFQLDPESFKPRVGFSLKHWKNSNVMMTRIGFISQKMLNSGTFERHFIYLDFADGNRVVNRSQVSISNELNEIIAIFNVDSADNTFLVFYLKHSIIEYCLKIFNQRQQSFGKDCLNEMQVLVDCSKQIPVLPIIGALVLHSVLIVAGLSIFIIVSKSMANRQVISSLIPPVTQIENKGMSLGEKAMLSLLERRRHLTPKDIYLKEKAAEEKRERKRMAKQ